MIDGTMAMRGVDPLRLPIARFCHLVLAWLRERMDDKEWRRFETRLYLPDEDEEPTMGPWSVEAQRAAFLAASSRGRG